MIISFGGLAFASIPGENMLGLDLGVADLQPLSSEAGRMMHTLLVLDDDAVQSKKGFSSP